MSSEAGWRRAAPIVAWLVLVYGEFLQRWGQITFDTKFDLTADPGPFMARSLHLWNQQSSFGELQNQAYGYLFPQGPFFALFDLVGMPAWLTQRLWWAVVLTVAYVGATAMSSVPTIMSMRVSVSAFLRPLRSAYEPSSQPPSGRMR